MIIFSYFSLANLAFMVTLIQQSDVVVSNVIESKDIFDVNIRRNRTDQYVFDEGVIDRRKKNSNQDIDESGPSDSVNPNTTFADVPRKDNEGSSFKVSTLAFLLAVIPMMALLGTFFVVQCKARSASALNAYVKTSKIKTESLDDEGSMSVDDKESQSSSRNPLFMQSMFEPQWNPQTAHNADILTYSDAFNRHH